MLITMEPYAVSQPPTSEPKRIAATEPSGTEKPYGDSYHKPVIVRGIFKGPILPGWAHSLWHRLFKSSAPSQ
jgi:hypothetical protein